MNGLDYFLVIAGFIGLLLSIFTMVGRGKAAKELLPVVGGSVGVIVVGLGGILNALWLMIVGGVLVAGAFIVERQLATLRKPSDQEAQEKDIIERGK